MKKLFFAALLTLTVGVSAFAAGNKKLNSAAAGNFKSQFSNASHVSWTVTDDYAKANFVTNDQRMEAFYNLSGEMIGTSKGISIDALPVNAKRTFAKKYDGYTVKEAILFEGADETAYYISADKGADKVILKVSEAGNLSTVQRSTK